jgi:mannose/cellobiose epimerase-like protein (N-acyl-D-glucosamine 2-epimerase family)
VTSWTLLPTHRDWLARFARGLLAFGRRTPYPGGGAAWLADDGAPWLDRGAETWIACRTVHVYAIGTLLGVPGARPVAEAALAGLTGRLRDEEHGGWYSSVGADGVPAADKTAYTHAFVVLAGSSAAAAGLAGGSQLLADALATFEKWFWDGDAGKAVDTWDTAFTTVDSYRGINANMHTVEAFLAAADVTGERVWVERAARIGAFAAHAAAGNEWRLPEHFDEHWNPRPELNADRPDDQFKPYGATVGHGLEWSRLLLHLEAAGAEGADWLTAAQHLFDRATTDGWAVDGADGFVYTTDWTGTPVVRDRMHWVAAEAIGAAAALAQRTGEPEYADWYARVWDYVERYLVDHEHGSWHHQLAPDNTPAATVWPGKADLYHAYQATLIPRLPLAPSLTSAIARGLLH